MTAPTQPDETARLMLRPGGGAARLGEDVFEIVERGQSVAFPYREVEQLRLSYRPRSLDYRVYRLDARMRDGRTVTLHNIASSPAAAFKPHERWDEGYRRFADGLVSRVAAAAPAARLVAGLPAWRFWPAAAVAAALFAFLAVNGVRALLAGDLRALAVAGLGLAVATWFASLFLWRNRPQPLRPGAIPREVLP